MPAKIKKKNGRPRKVITPEIVDELCKMARNQLDIESICRIKGFSADTFYAHCKTHPKDLERVHASKHEGRLALANTAMKMAIGDKANPMLVKFMNQVHNKWAEPKEAQNITLNVTLESLIAQASKQIEGEKSGTDTDEQ